MQKYYVKFQLPPLQINNCCYISNGVLSIQRDGTATVIQTYCADKCVFTSNKTVA